MFISLQYALERRERAEKTLFIGRNYATINLLQLNKKAYEELFMVNEEKVKIMNRLAMYEHGEGRK